MAYMKEEVIHYILLVDQNGYKLTKEAANKLNVNLKGLLKPVPVKKGGLYKLIPLEFKLNKKTKNHINLTSLNDDNFVVQCHKNNITQLSEVETELLLAIHSNIDRYDMMQKTDQLMKASNAKVGDHVLVTIETSSMEGILKYIGPINKNTGTMFGVYLTNPYGDSDGSISGTTYFECPVGHGIFVAINQINTFSEPSVLHQVYENIGQLDIHDDDLYGDTSNAVYGNVPAKGSLLCLGTRVIYCAQDGSFHAGVIRFLGFLNSSHGEDKTFNAGVELDNKSSTIHGNCFKGRKLFDCENYKGVIVEASNLLLENEFNIKPHPVDMSSCDNNKGVNMDADNLLVVDIQYTSDERTRDNFSAQAMYNTSEERVPDNFSAQAMYNNSSSIDEETTDGMRVSNDTNITETSHSNTDQTEKKLESRLLSLCSCSICFETVTNPRSLPCEHSFCKECIEEVLKFDAESVPFIKCPNCNTISYLQKGSTVDAFKASLLLKQFLGELNDEDLSDSEDIHTIPKCCEKDVSGYCGECDIYVCNECIYIHEINMCPTANVQYSKAKGVMLPFCQRHSSFKYSACKHCAEILCPYCKEEKHKGHLIVTLIEYSSLFRDCLSNKFQICKEYADKVKKIVNNPRNEPSHVTQSIANKEMILLSKCMYILDAIKGLQTSNVETSNPVKVPGSILCDKEKWISHQKTFEEMSSTESLTKKGVVELIYNTGSLLNKMSSISPEDIEETTTRIRVEKEKTDEDLIHVLSCLFGQLDVPCIGRNGAINTCTVRQGEHEKASLLTRLNEFNDGAFSLQYLRNKMKTFGDGMSSS